MAIRRYIRALGPALLLSLGGAYALASMDWCKAPANSPPVAKGAAVAQEALNLGAAKVELTPPLPIVMAGYPPSRPDGKSFAHPLYARATVLQVGTLKVAIASVDLLTMPESIVAKVRQRLEPLKLDEVWIAATHTHSSFGGYDPRLVSEIAGTGDYRDAAELAVISGTASAIEEAAKTLRPVTMEAGTGKFAELVDSRSEGTKPKGDLVHVVFREASTEDAGSSAIAAQWIFFAAHPTNVTRGTTELDADYPGFLSRSLEEKGSGPALFLQLAVGNASAVAEGQHLTRAQNFAERIEKAMATVPLTPVVSPRLSFARVEVPLPRVDAQRLVPGFFRRAGANFLCGSAPDVATVSGLQLGPLRLIAIPGEVTEGAAEQLENLSRGYPVSLVNGYVGYVETSELVEKKLGESKRQYFDETLLKHIGDAAQVAGNLLPPGP